ncbi:MAG: DUF4368 domain-containing protein, partial [Oscillospiraceae bacterium]|nr:DUF4368 domain-containing protein [Oscillospiraceae bacterium]
EDVLYEIVRMDIVSHISEAHISDEELKTSLSRTLEQTAMRQKKTDLDKTRTVQKRLNELTIIMRNLYEDKALGRIPEASYFAMVEQYQAELHETSVHLEVLQKEHDRTINADHALASFIAIAKKIASAEVITREMLRALIDRIEIGDGSVQDMNGREIAIYYKDLGKTKQRL